MDRVSPKVLALLGALTLVWGTNWPLFRIALDELPVWTFRTIVPKSLFVTINNKSIFNARSRFRTFQ